MQLYAMRFRRSSAIVALGAVLALPGCAGLSPDGPPPAPARPAAAPMRPSPVVAPPAPRPATKPSELNALRPSPRPEREAGAAQRLVGLSEDETIGLLGRPAEENPQPPGKIWIYRAGGCQLSVHLFPDMERGGYYALDYAAEGERDTCLGKVAGEARKRGGAVAEQASKSG